MTKPFLKVLREDEARDLLKVFGPLDTESAALDDALFRVLARRVQASEDIPSFNRSTMDGFAVRAADTFGATESSPALFEVSGEIRMGEIPDFKLGKGFAVRIWTGGALPSDADAVVMVEHTQELDERTIEVFKSVAPFENTVRKGEDFKAGEVLLGPGRRLRPQDLGLFAAMGLQAVTVHRSPVVSIMSSGDEIVPIDMEPPPGCVRDINRHTLHGLTIEAHAIPRWIGIAPDRLRDLSAMMDEGLAGGDVLVISGGSSMGSRDLVIEAIKSANDSEILLHGVSISPGKPLILARVGTKAVFGLPGHPVSAMVCFEQFVVPLIRRLGGEGDQLPFPRPRVQAALSRNLPSREGRTDYVRVKLEKNGDRLTAVPVTAKSGVISAMVRAHGWIRIEASCEGLYRGDLVIVHLSSHWIGGPIEKEYLSGHEISRGCLGDFHEARGPERLSRS
jgi:molybdopterin molybdotransferase